MSQIRIIPQPQELKVYGRGLDITRESVIILERNCSSLDMFAAISLQERIKQITGKIIPIRRVLQKNYIRQYIILTSSKIAKEAIKDLKTDSKMSDDLKEEGYVIDVDNKRVIITARDSSGLFYGVQTLIQLIRNNKERFIIPGIEIKDYPAFKYRGIMQDISRGQVLTMNSFKELVRILSYFKINLLSFYIEHTFQFRKHPLIGQNCGSLTKEDIKELDEYAKEYNVELVPSCQSFGHFINILRLKEYAHLAETESLSSLSPAIEGTYELLEDIFSEIIPAFSSQFFHIGCDEVWDLGKGHSREIAERIGVGNLFLTHVKKVKKILGKYNKKIMIWGDMFLHYPELISHIPKGMIIMNWHYEKGTEEHFRPFIERFEKAGLKQFLCTSIWGWTRLFPDFRVAKSNIKNYIKEGCKHKNIEGILTTNWGDDGHHNLLGYAWYGFLYSAAYSWSPLKVKKEIFDEAFCYQFFGIKDGRLAKALHLLSDNNYILGEKNAYGEPSNFSLYWNAPFNNRYNSPNVNLDAVRNLKRVTEEAMNIIKDVKPEVTKNKKYLDDIFFAAEEISYLAKRLLLIKECEEYYKQAYLNLSNERVVNIKLNDIIKLLVELRRDLIHLRRKFKDLWLVENRKPGLEYNLNKYDKIIKGFTCKIKELEIVKKDYQKPGGTLLFPQVIFPTK